MADMVMTSTSQSREGENKSKKNLWRMLWGIVDSAISQTLAQRDDVTGAFIIDRRISGRTHGSFQATLSTRLPTEYQFM